MGGGGWLSPGGLRVGGVVWWRLGMGPTPFVLGLPPSGSRRRPPPFAPLPLSEG